MRAAERSSREERSSFGAQASSAGKTIDPAINAELVKQELYALTSNQKSIVDEMKMMVKLHPSGWNQNVYDNLKAELSQSRATILKLTLQMEEIRAGTVTPRMLDTPISFRGNEANES